MKIIKLVIILFITIPFASAQSFVQLKVRMNSPADNSTVAPMEPFILGTTVTNMDTTPFSSDDSLALYIIMNNDTLRFFVNGHLENFKSYTGISLNQGDSTIISIPFGFDTAFAGKSLGLCVFVKPLNRDTKAISDTLLGDNKGCITVNVENMTSLRPQSANSQAISLHPNPGKDYVTVESDNVIESISIIDCLGKETSIPPYHLNTIDCSNLPCGVYTMAIQTESGIAYKKLIINR